jgi:hypothetical protein
MPVTKEYIFPHIPETELVALLILISFDRRAFNLLNVKGCYFYRDL